MCIKIIAFEICLCNLYMAFKWGGVLHRKCKIFYEFKSHNVSTFEKRSLIKENACLEKSKQDSVEDRQSRIAWQMVNEVSRRKSTVKAQLKVTSQEE